jgi:nicotinamidase-related amidase
MSAATTPLDRERTTLVVIDMQEKLLPTVFERERVLRNTILLMRTARALEIPIVLTTQYARGLGATVPQVAREAPGTTPLDKVAFGCLGDEHILLRLASLGRTQLLVAGIESHICVAQTVLGALGHHYVVHVASDATGSRAENNWRVGLARMDRAGAVISSAEMAVYELLRRSDGEAFRKILPLLKG